MTTERTKGTKGAPRTELVTVRFDPRTKYLMDLGARAQHRSLANFVEEAVEAYAKTVSLALPGGSATTLAQEEAALWDVDEADRLANLATRFPGLLTYEEQKLWKLVGETFHLLNPGYWFTGSLQEREVLRTHWQAFKDGAETGVLASDLAKSIGGDKAMTERLKFQTTSSKQLKAAVAERDQIRAEPAKKAKG